MRINDQIAAVTERIQLRSTDSRKAYLDRIHRAITSRPARAHLSCGNQAHAYAAMGNQKEDLAGGRVANLGIVTAYNDMLSAHQPFAAYPQIIKEAARQAGGTAQVAGGVPAMCDGVTQGQQGMELSLFSRDVIALAASVALSHNTFDAALHLGVCDKIVPGLVIAAQTFGHIPAIFVPAGPMVSGLPNDRKSRIRQQFAAGEVGRDTLMQAEMESYHGPGTCTFYGTANSNQMLMEFMGLHLPGTSFFNPHTPIREELTKAAVRRALAITALSNDYRPVGQILDEKAFVNGIVGLMATGGSTNLLLHLPAMARAGGIELDVDDFADISEVVPLMARVYPNGLADINHFHAAGGLAFLIRELLNAGLLHEDVQTNAGTGLDNYCREPKLRDGILNWEETPCESQNEKILRPAARPFSPTGGLKRIQGNLGKGAMKISAVASEHQSITAPARVFSEPDDVKVAFSQGELNQDCVIIVRFQGPKANGMPELHGLTPSLSVLLDRGFRVALVTDGRMSGASGKVPAAIHLSPEAADGGPLARIQDGDVVTLDARTGRLNVIGVDLQEREIQEMPDHTASEFCGQQLFELFRRHAGQSDQGASAIVMRADQ